MSVVEKEKLLVREHGISATYNLINFLNGMIGPGCFSVAMAFKQGGLWMSFFLVFFLGGISTVSMMKIVKCSQHLSRLNGHTYLDYGDMAESAFGSSAYAVLVRHKSKAKYFVNGCLIAFQVGVASVAYVFVVEHIQEILQHFNVGTSLTIKELLLLYTIPTILINFVRSIRAVTIVCTIGNIFIFASIALILEELFTSEHHWRELPWVTSFDGVVASAGSLLYSFEGQAMVLPLENKLKHPQDMLGWTGVLTTGMSLVTIIYSYCGFYGYITFGNAVQGSVTLNLPDSTVNVVVKFLLIFVVFFGNVLQLYVIIEMLWPKIKEKLVLRDYRTITISLLEYLFRIGVVCFAMLWAIAIPNLNEIIPFVGITAGMLLSLIIPSAIDVIVFYPVRSKSDSVIKIIWFVMHNLFLFIVGCFFLVSGLQANIVQLINKD
ncbi:hypothetical protein V3C99_007405 [Haemonchus contortus]